MKYLVIAVVTVISMFVNSKSRAQSLDDLLNMQYTSLSILADENQQNAASIAESLGQIISNGNLGSSSRFYLLAARLYYSMGQRDRARLNWTRVMEENGPASMYCEAAAWLASDAGEPREALQWAQRGKAYAFQSETGINSRLALWLVKLEARSSRQLGDHARAQAAVTDALQVAVSGQPLISSAQAAQVLLENADAIYVARQWALASDAYSTAFATDPIMLAEHPRRLAYVLHQQRAAKRAGDQNTHTVASLSTLLYGEVDTGNPHLAYVSMDLRDELRASFDDAGMRTLADFLVAHAASWFENAGNPPYELSQSGRRFISSALSNMLAGHEGVLDPQVVASLRALLDRYGWPSGIERR
jgi:hypothetical protein